MIVLDKVFRQKDSGFLRLLNELRRGIVSPETNITLQRKVQENKNRESEVKSSGFMKSSVMGAVAVGGAGEGKEEMVVRPTKLYAINRSETTLLCPVLYCATQQYLTLPYHALFYHDLPFPVLDTHLTLPLPPTHPLTETLTHTTPLSYPG
jgi:hypothetical protein